VSIARSREGVDQAKVVRKDWIRGGKAFYLFRALERPLACRVTKGCGYTCFRGISHCLGHIRSGPGPHRERTEG